VNYSGVASQKPKAEQFGVDLPGALDTVRWHTGQSGAPDQGSLRSLCSLLFEPFNFVLVYCEPLAPVEHIISSKLVSPIICVGQFNHQNYLGKGLTLIPFQQDPDWVLAM
jgi:hypothetical protein